MGRNRLTVEQRHFYEENGYLLGLPPILAGNELSALQDGYERIVALLHEDENPSDIIGWHKTSRWLYDLCSHPQILDYVEGILGPNFYLAGSEFITKAPHTDKVVPWHQDSYYWSTARNKTVTVWMAFTDVDEGNGAMKVIPRTHRMGLIKHKIAGDDSILSFELEEGSFSEKDAVTLTIPRGGISMHDDALIHGSPANPSDRWRIGYVIRYSKTEVQWDPEKYVDYRMFMMRGVDEYKHHIQGDVPTVLFGRPEVSKRIRKRG
jgi:ectoine hydroxylase-related dioxygenase (phytanoyl-CoA dioxygenase family)